MRYVMNNYGIIEKLKEPKIKKFFKIFALIIGAIIIAGILFGIIYSTLLEKDKSEPQASQSKSCDSLSIAKASGNIVNGKMDWLVIENLGIGKHTISVQLNDKTDYKIYASIAGTTQKCGDKNSSVEIFLAKPCPVKIRVITYEDVSCTFDCKVKSTVYAENIRKFAVPYDNVLGKQTSGITYEFTPEHSGIYRFLLKGRTMGLDLYITIRDYDSTVSEGKNSANCLLKRGRKYFITISRISKFPKVNCKYSLTVLNPAIGCEIDSANYREYRNTLSFISDKAVYTYKAPYTGMYCFKLDKRRNSHKVYINISDSDGNDLYSSWDKNAVVHLEKGKTYNINLLHDDEKRRDKPIAYTLKVYSQSPIAQITSEAKGSLYFKGQTDLYNFVADKTGSYSFITKSDSICNMEVFSADGNNLYLSCMQNSKGDLRLTKGNYYIIRITSARSTVGSYKLEVEYDKN